MARRLSILLVALFALSFAAVGCGDDDDDKKSDDTGDTPAQTDTAAEPAPTPTEPDTTEEDTTAPDDSGVGTNSQEELDTIVKTCKEEVDKSSAPEEQKEAAKKLCDAAGGGGD